MAFTLSVVLQKPYVIMLPATTALPYTVGSNMQMGEVYAVYSGSSFSVGGFYIYDGTGAYPLNCTPATGSPFALYVIDEAKILFDDTGSTP